MPTALITGASGGLGSAIAATLAPTHTLLLAGRPSKRLSEVAERLGGTVLEMDSTFWCTTPGWRSRIASPRRVSTIGERRSMST